MTIEVPAERIHILKYFELLREYRSIEYQLSEKYFQGQIEKNDSQISGYKNKIKNIQRELKKLPNRKYYGSVLSLAYDFDQRLEKVFPIYKTALGKSIVWCVLVVILIEIPIVFGIYATAAITLYFCDSSTKHKKTGYKYLTSEKDKLAKKIELLQVENNRIVCDMNNKRQNYNLYLNEWKSNLSLMERKVKEIFDEDKKAIIKAGLEILSIRDPENPESNSLAYKKLEQEPILIFDGIKSVRDSKSSIIEIPGHEEEIQGDILVPAKNFYSLEVNGNKTRPLKGIDGKYKYSVYEFLVIYLSSNFLSYYRCYWDFLRGSFVDREVSEYLYDSIVSIKTRERSSLNTKIDDERRIYRDLLVLTTMDNRTILFKMSEDKKEDINPGDLSSSYISEIYSAAESIRSWLRQRRVDRTRVEPIE